MRKIVCLLTALLLLAMLPFGVFADVDIQAMVNELPTVEEIQLMDLEEQQKAYLQVQEVYEIYMGLGEDRLKIVGGEEKFDQLFSWFNMQVMPLEQEPEEPEQDPLSNVASVVCIAGLFAIRRYLVRRSELKEEMVEIE